MKKYLILAAFLAIFLTTRNAQSTTIFAAPPSNFQVQQLVTQGLNGPSGMAIAPDGRVFILERTGAIKIVKNGALLSTPFATLPAAATGDRGLIGIAFDPEFSTNSSVYFYYTSASDLLNYLVRFNASGDVGTDGPTILYQTTSPSNQLHVGGSIAFGPDGKLYVAVGDNGYGPNAQNLNNPHGKILRINKDGTIPSDNPFVGQENKLPEIWAYGFRNPWRFQFDTQTGKLYGSDVGNDAWEEINAIEKGENYGWPLCEGNCSIPSVRNPLHAYPHNGASSAATGGFVYRGTMFPETYRGRYFFGDYAQGFLETIKLTTDGAVEGVEMFDPSVGSIVDMSVAPDGSVYYITYVPGRLYRLSYAEGNQLPVAVSSASVTKGTAPLTVQFFSTGSYDPDSTPLTFEWNFGDGNATSAASPVHTFTNNGTYLVEMSASDGTRSGQAVPIPIQVGVSPTVTIGQPSDGALYQAGDVINYTVHAVDGIGNDINDAALQTEVIFHHGTHIHPFLGPITGRTGSFTIPTRGEASADTWFEIRSKATDTTGLTGTQSIFIYPKKSTVTLLSNPSGLQLSLDGQPVTTPYTFTGVIGFERELSTLSPQMLGQQSYDFSSWSTGDDRTHVLTIPASDEFITAQFIPGQSNFFQGQYFNNIALNGTPVFTRADETINFDWGNGSPDSSIVNDLFSARWTKTEAFTSGVYRFSTTTDDGVRLYVDGAMVIDKWQDQSALTYAIDLPLQAGNHTIVLEYYERGAGAVAKLAYEKIAELPAPEGFSAEYFSNKTLTGTPTLTRSETAVNFDWKGGSPDSSIPNDGFSARFTKQVNFEAGTHNFTVVTDDGMRIFIDDTKVFDKWSDQSATYTFAYNLTEGNHTIRIEYFENGGDAKAIVTWDHLHDQLDGFTAQYYANQTLSGLPAVVRNDAAIDFDWGNSSPNQSIPADNFSVRWTTSRNFTSGTYRFRTRSDDGVRLKVNGVTYIDKWIDQSPKVYEADVILEGGDHTIVMEYFENGGGAVAQLSWEIVGDIPTTDIRAEYFGNPQLSGTPLYTTSVEAIDFDWGKNSPHTTVPADGFSARYRTSQRFAGGEYRFTVRADDGIRVYLDGTKILDKWVDQSATTYTVFLPISTGVHTIVVEYYENGGDAVNSVRWNRVSGPGNQGFQASYFSNRFLVGFPSVTRRDATIDFSWGQNSPDSAVSPDNFSARWTKTEQFDAGRYIFRAIGDDGVRVYLNDGLVIDGWKDQSSASYEADVFVPQGEHTITVEYYEHGGDSRVRAWWEPKP